MRSRSRIPILAAMVAIGVGLGGCAATPADERDTGQGATITVGAQNTLENRILAQIYGQVLADHGYVVDYNRGVGERAAFISALQAGSVDLIADTSGELLYAADDSASARSAADIDDELPDAVESIGLHVLDAAPADNAVAFVVSEDFASTRHVASIGELAYLADDITIGAGADFSDERYGPAGLLAFYGVVGFDTREIADIGGVSTVGSLLTNSLQVAVIPSTSPAIVRNNLRVLADPKALITAQNIIPLVNDTANTADVRAIVNPVSAEITTAVLQKLNALATASATPSPETIARDWLTARKLIRG